MTTRKGDISLLNDPVAQDLLQSHIPARLAYTGLDGTPRVVPVFFHWTGEEVIIGTPPGASKIDAIAQNPQVALTIDTEAFPAKALLIRGRATMEMVETVPEYAAATTRYLGEEGAKAWMSQIGSMFSAMARIAITPEWVTVLDFETRFPSVIENAMAAMQPTA